MSILKLLVLLIQLFVCVEAVPKYIPTKGEVWPKPREEVTDYTYYILEETFRITKPYFTCHILEEAIKRFKLNLARRRKFLKKKQRKWKFCIADDYFVGVFDSNTEFRIELTGECEDYPHLYMNEKYTLSVKEIIVLSSASIWGILRGLESFNHMLYYSDNHKEIRINSTTVTDYPAYPHRGLLIDTGRHYLRPDTINMIIDAMEMNKMNVLHWHIVDDESFPYQSERLPDLSKGAFHPSMVYTKEVIQGIIERARLAGIRVIPEFDAPGHVASWGVAYPDILTGCYDEFEEVVAYGPLEPLNNKTSTILQKLYQEVTELFPDEYIHLGGDEVDTDCWQSNLKIQSHIKSSDIGNVLRTGFLNAAKTMLPPKSKYIVWQDWLDVNVSLPDKTIVQLWKMKNNTTEIIKVLNSGNRVLVSSSWYLDVFSDTWETFFSVDPRQMVVNESAGFGKMSGVNLEDIVGGEACMWGEMVDDTNIISRMWPRASAVAERLWSGVDASDSRSINATDFTRRRMEEHACRMRHRGVAAEPPNGPGFCVEPLYSYD